MPFVSVATIYTNFRYPNYALIEKDTISKVISEGKTNPSLKIGAFLHLALPMKNYGFYPFVQLGISTDQSELILPLGAGFLLYDKISISAGTMLGYHKTLDQLKPGMIATQDQFDADLKQTVFGFDNWYFSLNYTIGK